MESPSLYILRLRRLARKIGTCGTPCMMGLLGLIIPSLFLEWTLYIENWRSGSMTSTRRYHDYIVIRTIYLGFFNRYVMPARGQILTRIRWLISSKTLSSLPRRWRKFWRSYTSVLQQISQLQLGLHRSTSHQESILQRFLLRVCSIQVRIWLYEVLNQLKQ